MKVLVVYHTIYGHTLQLARAVTEGVKSVAGVEAVFRRAPEFPHTEKELEAGEGYATQIWKDQKSIPACTLDDLREADGILLGSPTRYGNMTAQMKALIDSTASLWLAGGRDGRKTSGCIHLDGFNAWRTGDDLCHHDDPASSPRDAHRRRAVFGRRNDPHGSARRQPLRCIDHCRSERRAGPNPRRSRHLPCPGQARRRNRPKASWLGVRRELRCQKNESTQLRDF